MDGVSEDFSGLPQQHRVERESHRNERSRGRTVRIVISVFGATLLLVTVSLIVRFAPAPFLGVSHDVIASSIGGTSSKGCHPAGDGWLCWKGENGSTLRYKVRADWAGCWTGQPVGGGASGVAQPSISGCVTIFDHLTAG